MTLTTPNTDFDTLGGRLFRAREASETSLAETARLVGVETKTLRSWERDQVQPRSSRLTMLAEVLAVSPTWLLFGRGEALYVAEDAI